MKTWLKYFSLLLLGSAALAVYYVKYTGGMNAKAQEMREWTPEFRTVRPFVVPEKVNIDACIKVKKLLHGNSLKRLQTKQLLTKVFDLSGCPWIGSSIQRRSYRRRLAQCCNASHQLIVTQENSPVGHTMSYETDAKRKVKVTDEMFQLFVETSPFKNKRYETCSVVGNGGILLGSFCGDNIDQADFVFRINLPPLNYTDDVGTKVDLVTAKPSIIVNRTNRTVELGMNTGSEWTMSITALQKETVAVMDLWWVCRSRTYAQLPPNWGGVCALVTLHSPGGALCGFNATEQAIDPVLEE
ncbi:alpha-2,8-sialyltransferase 8F-like isoform X2 [Ambystoma mexicanum]|uniref:alpha-2,8-sialyltransferase 8F-like isoform X2 n=1 Tax=Ambystoma mexicanum TaxID=8296 RepID=UPI0037E903A8